jgi:hypothetical protein
VRQQHRGIHTASARRHARTLIQQVCEIAGQENWIEELEEDAADNEIIAAVASHDTSVIFNWLMWILSFQGVSDAVAKGYMEKHGNVTWAEIELALATAPHCEKLKAYWAFNGCGYHKGAQTCAEQALMHTCPLPRHRLRNGRLNQSAYSLYLFIRDVAGGDIVTWIDRQLEPKAKAAELANPRTALIDPLRNVYGISDKVIAMALATLLIGAGHDRPRWFEAGASFIVVDTLVHNFLHRTGILKRLGAVHLYGVGCYRHGGCCEILTMIAEAIDARRFNPTFPKVFPRFIQHAIWRYCAEGGLNICNGNQINDRARCLNKSCRLFGRCDRRVLNVKKL